MTASELTELAARVEAGSGEDHELNYSIAGALGWKWREASPEGRPGWVLPSGRYRSFCPDWTSSLDAVVALVGERLPGRDWNLIRCSGEFSAWFDSDPERHLGLCLSPPRSLLAATLRALAAQQQDRQTEGDSSNG